MKKEIKATGTKIRRLILLQWHDKLQYVQWHDNERKESLGIFAKNVDKKAREWLIAKGYKVWDLRDVEKYLI